MSEKTEHPELHRFMDNLYQASGDINLTVEQGFIFARNFQCASATPVQGGPIYEYIIMQIAAQAVRDVADELEISHAAQHAIWLKNQSGLGKGHVRLLHDE